MPYYGGLRPDQPHFARTVEGLTRLRAQLDAEIPDKNLETSLLLATWNIREFDSPAYGDRLEDAIYFIAEIISRFDLVAVQEVRADLVAFDHLMRVLGWQWDYLLTDVTEGTRGNQERLAFVYDRRKVRFSGFTGQLVLPPIELKQGNKIVGYKPVDQVARTPFFAGFSAGWSKWTLATVHIVYGKDDANDPERVKEIGAVATALSNRAKDAARRFDNLVLLGDFNIFATGDQTMDALTKAGWTVPEALQHIPGSNVPQDKKYDQIALRPDGRWFEPTGQAGVFDYYRSVFRDEDQELHAELMGTAYNKTEKGKLRDEKGKRTYYRTYWRTFQMSDHLPMWLELKIDYSTEYLQQRAQPPG